MHRGTWEYAVAQLQKEMQEATPRQIALASSVGITFEATTPRGVAAAMLKAALVDDLELEGIWPYSDRHQGRLKELRTDQDQDRPEIRRSSGGVGVLPLADPPSETSR